MPNPREIKLRIKGVNETKKITKAMKLIAAVKLKKAREMHEITLPFFKKIQETMSEILQRVPTMDIPYFDKREKKEDRKKAYIVITSDSGLTGGYNINVIKYATNIIDKEKDIVFPIGNTIKNHMLRNGYNVNENLGFDSYDINVKVARQISRNMIKLFKKGEIDEVELIYTEMESAMTLKPHRIKLLPLDRSIFEKNEHVDVSNGENVVNGVDSINSVNRVKGVDGVNGESVQDISGELEIEPSPEIVFDVLTRKYVKGIIYGGMVEAFVSENFSRMNAMDNATSNAEKMVEKLTLNYNRARQAAITQEISEIISGATNV